jgi:enoyl-CoA hydratase/carnithine racemase
VPVRYSPPSYLAALMNTLIQTDRDGSVLRLTLNRPEKRNALNAALCRELVEALESADADPAVHAVLLTAAGKSFCAGMDLAEIMDPPDPEEIDALHERLFTIGARSTTPIVAAVQGAALAGGTGLVANCHIAVAAPDATFGVTEIRIGLFPFLIFRSVSAAITERRAIELALTGRIFPAAEAREFGLIHEVAADPAVRAAEIARQIASASAIAIRKGLGCVHQSIDAARAARKEVFQSAEFQAGLRAFRDAHAPKPAAGAKEQS